MRIRVTFLQGTRKVAEVDAVREVDGDSLTVADMEQIIPTEQLLEKLTGLRVHIVRLWSRSPRLGHLAVMVNHIAESEWADTTVVPEHVREALRARNDWPFPEAWPSMTWREFRGEVASLAAKVRELESALRAIAERNHVRDDHERPPMVVALERWRECTAIARAALASSSGPRKDKE